MRRPPPTDGQELRARARQAFEEGGERAVEGGATEAPLDDAFGEVRVEVQEFRGIPMLVKVSVGMQMHREALPERFTETVNRAGPASPNMLTERRWVDQGARYGELTEIAQEVAEEIDIAFDEQRLEELVKQAVADGTGPGGTPTGQPHDGQHKT